MEAIVRVWEIMLRAGAIIFKDNHQTIGSSV